MTRFWIWSNTGKVQPVTPIGGDLMVAKQKLQHFSTCSPVDLQISTKYAGDVLADTIRAISRLTQFSHTSVDQW
jgi:hypothetical protein